MREAANALGVNRITLWRAMRDGKLVGQRERGRVFFEYTDLLDYVIAHRDGRGITTA